MDLKKSWDESWDGMGSKLTEWWNTANDVFSKVAEFLGPIFADISKQFQDQVGGAIDQVKKSWDEFKNSFTKEEWFLIIQYIQYN
jgi:hypothetical protein